MPNPDLLSPGYAPFVVSNPDLEGLSAASPLRASHSLLRVPVLAGCWGMVVSDEECSSDDNEFHGFDSNEDDDDDMFHEQFAHWFNRVQSDEGGASSAQSDAPGRAFAHQGHDQSPSKGSVLKPAKSAVSSPPIRRSIPSKQISTDRWVEEGAAHGFISEEFQSIPLLHPDMQKSWVEMQPPLRRARDKTAGSAAAAASTAAVDQPFVKDGSEDDSDKAPKTDAVEPPGPSTKKVRRCEHRVGQVPTLGVDTNVGFMVMGKTVEDLEQLMKSRGGRQGSCCLLWNGDKARGNSVDPRTTSAKWVCKTDVMLFAQQKYGVESSRIESMCQQAMKGKNAFAEFVQFLAKNLNSACGFIFQAQLMTADQRASYSYRDSQAAKDVTIWLNGHADRVQGNSAHKQRLMTNAAKDPSSVDRGDDFGLDDKRAFITMFADHRCPERSVPSGPPVIDGDQESDSVSLTSASALAMREHMKRMTGRGPTPKSLAYTLQLQEPSRVMQETSLPRLNDKLAFFGPSNPAVAKQVRRFLVGGGPVDETTLNNLLQGAIAQARDDGDYAELIEASAQEVRDRMHEIAEARYRNQWKRACAGRPGKMPPFDPSRANIPQVDDRDEFGNPISYLIGWCLAPGYVRKGIEKDTFCKYSAIDCAFAKRRGQGTFYLEAILGGDRSIHIAFVMQLLTTECDFGVNLHHKHMRTAYQDKFNSKDFVCVVRMVVFP